MAETIQCRRARSEDANAIATAHVLAWQTAYVGHIPAGHLAQLNVEESQRRWDERLELIDPNVFVAELAAEVVGFCSVGPSRDIEAKHNVGEVTAIYLHPRVWRNGVGSHLLRFSSDVLREHGYAEAMLWVLEGNERARAFYAACGWELDRRPSGRKTVTEIANVALPHLRYRCDL